jgi:hypothetical protein
VEQLILGHAYNEYLVLPQKLGMTGATFNFFLLKKGGLRPNSDHTLCGANKHKEEKRTMYDQIISESYTTLINLSPTPYRKGQNMKKERCLSYHHYSSPVPSGGLRATDEGTLYERDSEARWV